MLRQAGEESVSAAAFRWADQVGIFTVPEGRNEALQPSLRLLPLGRQLSGFSSAAGLGGLSVVALCTVPQIILPLLRSSSVCWTLGVTALPS